MPVDMISRVISKIAFGINRGIQLNKLLWISTYHIFSFFWIVFKKVTVVYST